HVPGRRPNALRLARRQRLRAAEAGLPRRLQRATPPRADRAATDRRRPDHAAAHPRRARRLRSLNAPLAVAPCDGYARSMSEHLRRIGDQELRPESLMMSYGYDPRRSEGAIKSPIFM